MGRYLEAPRPSNPKLSLSWVTDPKYSPNPGAKRGPGPAAFWKTSPVCGFWLPVWGPFYVIC